MTDVLPRLATYERIPLEEAVAHRLVSVAADRLDQALGDVDVAIARADLELARYDLSVARLERRR